LAVDIGTSITFSASGVANLAQLNNNVSIVTVGACGVAHSIIEELGEWAAETLEVILTRTGFALRVAGLAGECGLIEVVSIWAGGDALTREEECTCVARGAVFTSASFTGLAVWVAIGAYFVEGVCPRAAFKDTCSFWYIAHKRTRA